MNFSKSSSFFLAFLCALPLLQCTRAALIPNLDQLRGSIFRITVNSQAPDWDKPWTRERVVTSYGSGFYIGDKRILTNAHVVKYAKHITIKGDRDPRIIEARVQFIAHDCDLALITVDEADFFKGKTPIQLGDVPELSSEVRTVGYPSGAQEIAVTEGVVSRLAFRTYSHPALSKHLLIQVDSAQNPGNSGGPVIQHGKAIGVAFQGARALENTNFVIPTPIIRRFLNDISDGIYDGEMQLHLDYAENLLLNVNVREYLGLRNAETSSGVPISHISPWSPFSPVLKMGDILLKIDDLLVATDGTVTLFKERLPLDTYIDLKNWGDEVHLHIIRDGKALQEKLVLRKQGTHFEPKLSFEKPRYIVYAGHVFAPLTLNYLLTFGSKWYDEAPLLLRRAFWDFEEEEDLAQKQDFVVLMRRLPHKYTKYSGSFLNNIVTSIDETAITSFAEFNAALKEKVAAGKPFFIYFWRGEKLGPLLIDPKSANEVHQEILRAFNIENESSL